MRSQLGYEREMKVVFEPKAPTTSYICAVRLTTASDSDGEVTDVMGSIPSRL